MFFVSTCFFVTDLHGRINRYRTLFKAVENERPEAVFFGGDLLPHGFGIKTSDTPHSDFVGDFLEPEFSRLKDLLGDSYPRVFLIMGNDDARVEERSFVDLDEQGLIEYVHNRRVAFGAWEVYGYACVPPTPFMLKDWERYDVSRGVDPGCVSPEEGFRTVEVPDRKSRFSTIREDLENLVGDRDLSRSIFLFHTPPYKSKLDRAALDGKSVDHVPLDVHVGSIAVQRFIESGQPHLTLHGHIHESTRLTGDWREQFGRTWAYSAAHDGRELALVRFDPESPEDGTIELLQGAL